MEMNLDDVSPQGSRPKICAYHPPKHLSNKYTSIFEIYLLFLQLDRNSITKSTRFVTEVHADFIDKLEAGEIDTERKQKKLLDAYAEELLCKYPQCENLRVFLLRA